MPSVRSQDGTTIAYEAQGAGPTMIVVMGATQYRAVDQSAPRLAALLADAFTVVLYDRRGRGESGDTRPYAPGREIEDIAALVDAHGGMASLYGLSSGAMLAIEAATALPGKIARVVAYEPPVQPGRPAAETEAETAEMEALAATGDGDACMRSFMGGIGMTQAQIDSFAASPAWAGFADVGTTIAHDFRILADAFAKGPALRLATLETPVLVVDGDQSFGFMAAGADAVAEALPHATRKTLTGQGHGPDPEAIAPIIRQFLA